MGIYGLLGSWYEDLYGRIEILSFGFNGRIAYIKCIPCCEWLIRFTFEDLDLYVVPIYTSNVPVQKYCIGVPTFSFEFIIPILNEHLRHHCIPFPRT